MQTTNTLVHTRICHVSRLGPTLEWGFSLQISFTVNEVNNKMWMPGYFIMHLIKTKILIYVMNINLLILRCSARLTRRLTTLGLF